MFLDTYNFHFVIFGDFCFIRKIKVSSYIHVSFLTEWQFVALFVLITETFPKKILRESRSELLKPLLIIAELCPKTRKTVYKNMEILTKNKFESWMQKLMERIDRQDELLLSLQPSGKAPNPIERIRMFDNQDLCMLLQISKRTLQRYRSIGALPYKTLGKKTYYSEEDVLTFLSGHVKDFKKEDIAFYKARIHNFFQK